MELVLALLTALYEEAKSSLVTAAPQDVSRFQGTAMAYRRLIDMLTRPSLTGTEDNK